MKLDLRPIRTQASLAISELSFEIISTHGLVDCNTWTTQLDPYNSLLELITVHTPAVEIINKVKENPDYYQGKIFNAAYTEYLKQIGNET